MSGYYNRGSGAGPLGSSIDSAEIEDDSIVDADINASAAIAFSKMAALTVSEMVIADGSGFLVSAAVATYPSLTELTYLKGVTSAIQTQLDGKLSSSTPTISSATPTLIFKDTDATAGDNNATILVAATDTGAGTEDIDVTFTAQVAGTPVNWITFDADGDTTILPTGGVVLKAGVAITTTLDEDNMVSDSATALATQQSIKAYVDTQVAGSDSLAEVLAIGNTTGGTDIIHYDATNDGNPEFKIGAVDAEELHIQAVYDTGAQTLDYVIFQTDVASVAADKGLFRFNVDGTAILDIDDGGIVLANGMGLELQEGITFTGATGVNLITITDDLEDGLLFKDAGGGTAFKIKTTNGFEEVESIYNLKASGTMVVVGATTLATSLTGVLRADSGVIATDSDVTDLVTAASTTAAGKVELAIASETTTGTDATRAVTPDGLAGSDFGIRPLETVAFDFTVNTATGDGKAYMTVPDAYAGMNLVAVHGRVITAGTTGTLDVQINNVTQAADMLTTKLTIDSAETGSGTAATPAVIDTANDDVAAYDLLRIDVDAVHTTPAIGLIITLEFQLP